jgi:hypothetical protein
MKYFTELVLTFYLSTTLVIMLIKGSGGCSGNFPINIVASSQGLNRATYEMILEY